MNNLISKSKILTDEEYRNIIATETNNLLYILLVLIFFLTVFAVTYYLSKKIYRSYCMDCICSYMYDFSTIIPEFYYITSMDTYIQNK